MKILSIQALSLVWGDLYRQELNIQYAEKIEAGVCVRRVESFHNLERLSEVLWYSEEFPGEAQYQVQYIPSLNLKKEDWFPIWNVTIFDGQNAICGGFHNQIPKDDEPFLEINGRMPTEVCRYYFDKLWDNSLPFTEDKNKIKIANSIAKGLESTADDLQSIRNDLDGHIKKGWIPRP